MDIVAIRSTVGGYVFALQVRSEVEAEWTYSILITQIGGSQVRSIVLGGLPTQAVFEDFCAAFVRCSSPAVAEQTAPLQIACTDALA